MKFKLIGAIAVILATAAVLCASVFQINMEKNNRVHQHLTASEKEPCAMNHSDGGFCTHLPLIVIDTGGLEIPGVPSGEHDIFEEKEYTDTDEGESMITVRMNVFDSETNYNHPTDVPTLSTATRIRVRGHSSRAFEKPPYLLKLVTDDGVERDEALLGMSEHSEWALHGPYLDKSLIRNYLFYNLSGEIMDYAPNCRFCEVILNGDYRGVYLLVETITASEDGRLPIMMKEKNNILSGYLLRIDRPTEQDLNTVRDVDVFTERNYIQRLDVAIRYPGKSRLTEDLRIRIERDFSAFEKALYSFDYDSDDYGYQNYIDIESFIDYYLINAFSGNADAGRFSTYIYKPLSGKYKLCVWDFNNACDNYISDAITAEEDIVREYAYFDMLFRNSKFVDRVITRYRELRKSLFSDEYIDRYIDETIAYLGDAVDRNSARWADYIAGNQLDIVDDVDRNDHSQAEAVERVKTYLSERGAWLDENIDYLRQYAAASANKTYNDTPE